MPLNMHNIRCQMTEAPILGYPYLAQQSAGIWRRARGWGWLRATPQNRQLGGSPASGVCLKLRSHSMQRQHDTPVHSSKVTGQRGTRRSTPCTGHQHSLRLGHAAVQANSTIFLWEYRAAVQAMASKGIQSCHAQHQRKSCTRCIDSSTGCGHRHAMQHVMPRWGDCGDGCAYPAVLNNRGCLCDSLGRALPGIIRSTCMAPSSVRAQVHQLGPLHAVLSVQALSKRLGAALGHSS